MFQYGFMVRAFAAGLVIAVTAPLIGSFLVIRRFSLVADTLSHVALAGVAIGLLTGTQPLITTVILTMIVAFLIEAIRSRGRLPAEAVLAIFLPGGLALAVVLISFANGFNAGLFSYLFGSITTVQPDEVWLILLLGLVAVVTIVHFYRPLLYSSFDEDSARASGINTKTISLVLMLLTAVTVSLSMRIVGVLLIGALMVIPVTTAMQVSRSFKQGIFLAIALALAAVTAGLVMAYYLNLPAGGVIVLLSLALFAGVTLLKQTVK